MDGDQERPRLAVYRSNQHIYAQVSGATSAANHHDDKSLFPDTVTAVQMLIHARCNLTVNQWVPDRCLLLCRSLMTPWVTLWQRRPL